MEWRQQTSVSCEEAFSEAQRWIEEVTGKLFGCSDFRAALEDGVLLCDLINQLKPGIIKRVNRLSTPIAGLDNVSVFLKACGKLGLNDSQLFHPGDLQDLSTRVTLRRDESKRRLKNVLITIYWLGRKAQLDTFYSGPQLNFKAFEGLLGLALSKALEEGSIMFVKDGGYRECRYPEEDECQSMRQSYKRGNLMDGIESPDTHAVQANDEGCGSDAEAEQVFRMENTNSALQNKGYIPPPLRRKQALEKTGGCMSPLPRIYQIQVRPERPVQVNPGWIWSKSLSDIPMVYPVRKVSDGSVIHDKGQGTSLSGDWNKENRRQFSVAVKDSEAQWQDDLTKWKNRRRSTKSELHSRSQDREHVMHQMTNGAIANSDTNDVEGGPRKRNQSPWNYSSMPRPYSACSPSKPSGSELRQHSRALLARSYATDTEPSSPSIRTQRSSLSALPASDVSILGVETTVASLASEGAAATMPLDLPFTSQSQIPLQSTIENSQTLNAVTNEICSPLTTTESNDTVNSSSNWDRTSSMSVFDTDPSCIDPKGKTFCPEALNQAGLDVTKKSTAQHYQSQEGSQKSFWDRAGDGLTRQETGALKYQSRMGSLPSTASLPRGYRRSEGSSRLSSAITAKPFAAKLPRVSSLPRPFSLDAGSLMNNEEDCLSASTKPSFKRQMAAAHLRGQYQASVRQKKGSQAKQNGKEPREDASSSSFFSQTSLQNNGHPHLPRTYSNLQPYHRKSVSLPSKMSTELLKVDHSDMRVSLTLKPNSVPDFGFHTHWDSTGARITFVLPGSPAELCRLSVGDEIVAVDGVAVAHMTYNQWKDKMASSLQTGSLTIDIRRYGIKDWSTTSHHNQSSQSRMTLNLTATAPVLIGCPGPHARSAAPTETTDTQVFQNEPAGGLVSDNPSTARSKDYVSITRKNQKRRAEFFEAKGGSESAISDLQVPSLGPSSSDWSWDREEDRRRQEKWQKEQERLLKEQYQRDQERLEAEWQRAQQDAEEGRKSGQNEMSQKSFASTTFYVNGLKKTEEKLNSDGDELKEAATQRVQNDKITEKEWAEGSYGFAQLSPAHRGKSLSTPVLAGPYIQTGDNWKRKGQSKAEQERQQILEEMKKRTQLLTDNSWIRQRSSSFHKEPICVGVSMKRYESLDNLDALRQPPDSASTFSYSRSHSAAGGYCAPTRNASSRYSTGSISSQRNAYTESSHHARMVSGRRTCCVCERVLGSGAAMVIEALSLCFHLTCFQCVGCYRRLGRTEAGVQVRIRDRKPYCDYCYFQLK
ncbi:LIM domain only protein 7-like isoform 3-T4 [Menidia menidia]